MFKKIIPVCEVMFLRFFSLYILISILPIYAKTITDSALLIGLIMSGFYITQVLFQIPLSILSDKIGRKNVLYIGSFILIIGSLISIYAVRTNDADLLFIGRLIQGVSAVTSILVTVISDLVPERKRTISMAFFGISIGAGTMTAMVITPLLLKLDVSMEQIFYILIVLEIINIFIVKFKIANPQKDKYEYNGSSTLKDVLKNRATIFLAVTNLVEKGLISFTFLVIPVISINLLGWDKSELYKVFIPSAIIGLIATGFSGFLADAKQKPKLALYISFVSIFIYAVLLKFQSDTVFIVSIILFFVGFNMVEPLVQATASKVVKSHQKSRGIALVNTFGLLGTALGPILGGMILHIYKDDTALGLSHISNYIAIIILILILTTVLMKSPLVYKTIYFDTAEIDSSKYDYIKKNAFDYYTNISEKILIYKFDPNSDTVENIKKNILKKGAK